MLKKIKLTWHSLSIANQVYSLAVALMATALLTILIEERPNRFFTFASIVSSLLFSLGFGLWAQPWLKEKWQSTLGKWSLTALHAAIFFFAFIPSRRLVAESLGLPPQDFDMTVNIFALVLYPMLWILVLSVLTSLFSFVVLTIAAICSFSTSPLVNETLLFSAKLLSSASRVRSFIENERASFVSKLFAHAMGALTISILAAAIWDISMRFFLQTPSIIRWVAYNTDYQQAYQYPGIDHSKRIRLHENGVVSYAAIDGWSIEIIVDKVKD